MPFYDGPASNAAASIDAVRTAILPAILHNHDQQTTTLDRVSRVAQLDAYLLDDELHNILSAPVLATLSPAVRASWAPELNLALRTALLHLGLSSGSALAASYGAKLQNLAYRNLSAKRRWIYLVLAVLPPYLHSRLRDAMLVAGWPDYPAPRSISAALSNQRGVSTARRKRELQRVAWDALLKLETALSACRLLNFLSFLYDGQYPSLIARLLRLRFSYAQKSVARNVSFDFLNRQLVWEAFTEFLLFIIPLIELRAIRRWISRSLYRHSILSSMYALIPSSVLRAVNLPASSLNTSKARKHRRTGSTSSITDENSKPAGELNGPLAHLPLGVCPICHSQATAPGQSDPSAEIADPIDPTTSTALLASLNPDTLSNAAGRGGVGVTTGALILAGGTISVASSAAYVGQEATVPYAADCCGVLYCYFCISSALVQWEQAKKESEAANERQAADDEDEEAGWPCLRCNMAVTSAHRYRGKSSPPSVEGNVVGQQESPSSSAFELVDDEELAQSVHQQH